MASQFCESIMYSSRSNSRLRILLLKTCFRIRTIEKRKEKKRINIQTTKINIYDDEGVKGALRVPLLRVLRLIRMACKHAIVILNIATEDSS